MCGEQLDKERSGQKIKEMIAKFVEAKPTEGADPNNHAHRGISEKGWWGCHIDGNKLPLWTWVLYKHALTDLAAAMQAFLFAREKMGKHWRFNISSNDGLDSGPEWAVDIYKSGHQIASSENDDLKRAICNALVKLIKWEQEQK